MRSAKKAHPGNRAGRWGATLDRWRKRLAAAALEAAFQGVPDLAAATLEIEASRFRFRGIPHLFASDLVEIDPALNDDLLELQGRSELTLANRFGFFGKSAKYGAEVEWEDQSSAAWRNELHSFDYALDLALAYRISGDGRAARHLRYLIAHWISSNPPGQSSGWDIAPLARRIRNWILAADLARLDWNGDAEFLSLLTKSLALQVVFLSWQRGSANAGRASFFGSRAMLVASRWFEGAGRHELEEKAFTTLAAAAGSNVSPWETHYLAQPAWQFELSVALLDHLLFAGEEDGPRAEWVRAQLRDSLQALEGTLLPDGTLPLFGREILPSPEALSDLLAMSAVLLRDGRWKSLAGGFGILPYMLLGEAGKARFEDLPATAWHADSRLRASSGMYRLSDRRASALLINGRRSASAKCHNDLLSFELFIDGQRTVVESGAFSPPDDHDEEYFASALAHNMLLIDGHGPRPYASCPEDVDVLQETQKVQGLKFRDGGFRASGVSHERAFCLLENRYWVVLDRLAGKGVHDIESLAHFYPTFEIEVSQDRAFARSGAASVTLLPVSKSDTRLIATGRETGNPPGWYSPAVGVKYPSAVLTLKWNDVQLPWVGGYVITAGTSPVLQATVDSISDSEIVLNLNGKRFTIPRCRDEGHEPADHEL